MFEGRPVVLSSQLNTCSESKCDAAGLPTGPLLTRQPTVQQGGAMSGTGQELTLGSHTYAAAVGLYT